MTPSPVIQVEPARSTSCVKKSIPSAAREILSRSVSARTASKRASGSGSETGSDRKNADTRFETPGSPDGERTFTVRFVRGEKVKEFSFKVPVLIERGVYRAGQTYERGDGGTYQGSFWIAQKDTSGKPGECDGWRLSVKKGRDGKDGERGLKGDPGQKGRDGRDFSQTAFPGVR